MNAKSIQEMLAVSKFIREISANSAERSRIEALNGAEEKVYEETKKIPSGTLDLFKMLKSPEVLGLNSSYAKLLSNPADSSSVEAFKAEAKGVNERIKSGYPRAFEMLKGYSGDVGNMAKPIVNGETPEQFVVGIVAIFGVVVIIIGAAVNVAVAANAVSAANATFIVNVNVDGEP